MSTHSLRVLGIGGLKKVYKLDPSKLCAALQDAAGRRIGDRQLWDALLYRAAVLRSELKAMDLALVADAIGKARHRDMGFMEHLLMEVRAKARRFSVYDVALLTNALAKLAVRDESISTSLLPPLLRRIREQTRADNLALLALAYARLGDPACETVLDRIVAVLLPRIDSITDGHTLSTLLCAFALPAGHTAEGVGESLFRLDNSSSQATAGSGGRGGEPEHFAHAAFVEMLLGRCDQSILAFRSNDILHLCLALATLVRRGKGDMLPPRLLQRVAKRAEMVHFQFLPAQAVRLLGVLADLPDLEALCAPRLLGEVAYRIRSAHPQSCMATLSVVRRLGGHPKAHSAACWRLCGPEAAALLTSEEICEVAETLAALKPHIWEAREALLSLLQGMSQRQLQPEPAQLARLLHAFGEVSVRDTHWFHICQKLCLEDLSKADGSAALPTLPPEAEPLGEQELADAALALARLNLPRLADASLIFQRAAASVRSPRPAAVALEAAAIFRLIQQRPRHLGAELVSSLWRSAARRRSSRQHRDTTDPHDGLSLFPFVGEVADASECEPDVLAVWQAAAAARRVSALAAADDFELAVGRELSSWAGVQLWRAVQVGPLRVPYALSLVELAEHLKGDSSFGGQEADGGEGVWSSPADDAGWEAESPSPGEGEEPRTASASGRGRTRRRNAGLAGTPSAAHGAPSPESHVLVELLREADFYHASARIRGARQRAKGRVLGATRFAELSLLKREGWHVCAVPEFLWKRSADEGEEASRANKELIFRLVAALGN